MRARGRKVDGTMMAKLAQRSSANEGRNRFIRKRRIVHMQQVVSIHWLRMLHPQHSVKARLTVAVG